MLRFIAVSRAVSIDRVDESVLRDRVGGERIARREKSPGAGRPAHSHSIVAGGFDETSYVTRLMPRTSLMMRVAALPKNSCGKGK